MSIDVPATAHLSGVPTPPWVCWRDPHHGGGAVNVLGWPECTQCGAAPSYQQRHFLAAQAGLVLPLFTPVAPTPGTLTLEPRSAVVGAPDGLTDTGSGRVLVYFEGWVHGSMQYADRDTYGLWEAGVQHAAGRLLARYPTVAAATMPREELTVVGSYDVSTGTVTVTDADALSAWLA